MAFLASAPVCAFHGAPVAKQSTRRRLRARAAVPHAPVRMEAGEIEAGSAEERPPGEEVVDVSASTRAVSSEELKRELFLLCGAVDRGFSASTQQRKQVLDTVAALEASATCEEPLEDERLLGDWTLVYTNALDIVSLALLRPVAAVAGVYQNVRARDGGKFDVINVVELEPAVAPVANLFWGRTCSRLEVAAVGTRRADEPRKIDITFERGRIRQETFGGYEIPASAPSLSWPFGASPVGFIETTYLDDELRIARSPPIPGVPEDGVFVLRKV